MRIAEKLSNMCFSKLELRDLLKYDEYLELDFISEDLKISKESIIEEINIIADEKSLFLSTAYAIYVNEFLF